MKNQSNLIQRKWGLLGTICGGLLLGLPTIPVAASADATNPCPSIYYSQPYDSTLLVPNGCPANTLTRQMGFTLEPIVPLTSAPNNSATIPTTPPLPQNRSNPIATVTPTSGTVDVKLTNETNVPVAYEAISYTQRRFLAAGEEIILRGLPTPVTITMVRQDDGFLEVMPMQSSESGLLEVSLDEETNFDNNQGVLRIQSSGQVFLN